MHGSDRTVCPVQVLENVPYGAGGEARHAVPDIFDIDVVDGIDELVFEGIVDRFEEAEFERGLLVLAFHVSDLSVGGSWCYDRMNARVERDDKFYAGAEDIFGIRRNEDAIAEVQITAGRVHGSGVLIERGVHLGNAKVVGCPVDFGDGGVWEALPDFLGSSDADTMIWAGAVDRSLR